MVKLSFLMNKENYKHIIWDWNGTLVDDAWLCVDVMNQLLVKRGMTMLTVDRYREVFDFPVKEYYRKLGFNFDEEPFEVPGTEFIEGYRARWREAHLQADTMTTLQKIHQAGITQSLLSAAIQQLLEEMTDYFGITNRFIRILGLDNHYAYGKMEIGKVWMEKLGFKPHEVLLIGDTVHDHEVAVAIGVDCVLFTSGHQVSEKLSRCGVPLFETLSEISDYIVDREGKSL